MLTVTLVSVTQAVTVFIDEVVDQMVKKFFGIFVFPSTSRLASVLIEPSIIALSTIP